MGALPTSGRISDRTVRAGWGTWANVAVVAQGGRNRAGALCRGRISCQYKSRHVGYEQQPPSTGLVVPYPEICSATGTGMGSIICVGMDQLAISEKSSRSPMPLKVVSGIRARHLFYELVRSKKSGHCAVSFGKDVRISAKCRRIALFAPSGFLDSTHLKISTCCSNITCMGSRLAASK